MFGSQNAFDSTAKDEKESFVRGTPCDESLDVIFYCLMSVGCRWLECAWLHFVELACHCVLPLAGPCEGVGIVCVRSKGGSFWLHGSSAALWLMGVVS